MPFIMFLICAAMLFIFLLSFFVAFLFPIIILLSFFSNVNFEILIHQYMHHNVRHSYFSAPFYLLLFGISYELCQILYNLFRILLIFFPMLCTDLYTSISFSLLLLLNI